MDNGKNIPYVPKCLHLGNTNSISTTCTKRSMINNAIVDLNINNNNLLTEFSVCILYLYYSSPTV